MSSNLSQHMLHLDGIGQAIEEHSVNNNNFEKITFKQR